MKTQYVIEKRNADGSLDLSGLQPEKVFGLGAIQGISEDAIAKVIFAKVPDASLHGTNIPLWATAIDPKFVIRKKTW
jgi:hypothetical protein